MKVSPVSFGDMVKFDPSRRKPNSGIRTQNSMRTDTAIFSKQNNSELSDYTKNVRDLFFKLEDPGNPPDSNTRIIISYKFGEVLSDDKLRAQLKEADRGINHMPFEQFFETAQYLMNALLKHDEEDSNYIILRELMEDFGLDIEEEGDPGRFSGVIDIDDLGKAINTDGNSAEIEQEFENYSNDMLGAFAFKDESGPPIIALRFMLDDSFNIDDCLTGAKKIFEIAKAALDKSNTPTEGQE